MRRCIGAFIALLCASCTDLTFVQDGTDGRRISSNHILAGRPNEQGGPRLGNERDVMVSTDLYLFRLDRVLSQFGTAAGDPNDRLGFIVDIYGNATARAKGVVSRVDIDASCTPGPNCPPRVTINNRSDSPRVAASDVGAISIDGLLREYLGLCASDDAALARFFGLSGVCSDTASECFVDAECNANAACIRDMCDSMLQTWSDLRSASNYIDDLRLGLQDVSAEWVPPDPDKDPFCPRDSYDDGMRCSPVLSLRAQLTVDADLNEGFWPAATLDFDWSSIVADFRIYPQPCGLPGQPRCDTAAGAIYSPPPDTIGPNTLRIPPLNLDLSGNYVSDDFGFTPDPVVLAGCYALFFPTAITSCSAALEAQARTYEEVFRSADPVPGMVAGFGTALKTLVSGSRLVVENWITVEQLEDLCEQQNLPAGVQTVCRLPLDIRNDLFTAIASQPLNMGDALFDTRPDLPANHPAKVFYHLGGASGAWTDNTFRVLRAGGALRSVTIDLAGVSDLCLRNFVECAGAGDDRPPGCLFCDTACPGGVDAAGVCAQLADPVVVDVGTLPGLAVTVPPLPQIAEFAQLLPVFSVGARDLFVAPLDQGQRIKQARYCGVGGEPRAAACPATLKDDTDSDVLVSAAMFTLARDEDLDGLSDEDDNCPTVSNVQQADVDEDGIGNACDSCLFQSSTGNDIDGDGLGDECDCDADADRCNDPREFVDNDGLEVVCEASFANGVFDQRPAQSSGVCLGFTTPRDCTLDDDNDGVLDDDGPRCRTGSAHFPDRDPDEVSCSDNCACVPNPSQALQRFNSYPSPGQSAGCDWYLKKIGESSGDACSVAPQVPPSAILELANIPCDALVVGIGEIDRPGQPGPRPEICYPNPDGPDNCDHLGGVVNPSCLFGPGCAPGGPACPSMGSPFVNPGLSLITLQGRDSYPGWSVSAASLELDSGFSSRLVRLEDFDRDGESDFVAAAPRASLCAGTSCSANVGRIMELGSRSGIARWSSAGASEPMAEFGSAIASCDARTLYVSAVGARNTLGDVTGAVYELDMAQNPPLITNSFYGERGGDRFGQSLEAVCSGDRTSAIFVGAPNASPNGLGGAGRIYGLDPDGRVFATYDGTKSQMGLGYSIAVMMPNVIAEHSGALFAGAPNAYNGRGAVVSFGLGGNILASQAGTSECERFGASIRSVNLDSTPLDEIIIGAPGYSVDRGRVLVVDDRLRQLGTFQGLGGSYVGAYLSAPGDLDSNGRADIAAAWQAQSDLGTFVRLSAADGGFVPSSSYGGPAPMFRNDPAHTGRGIGSGPTASASVAWSTNLSGTVLSTPAVDSNGNIYVVSGGRLYSIASTGSQRWSQSGFSTLVTSPAVGPSGTVYAVDQLGDLAAVSPSTGNVLWRFHASGPLGDTPTIGPDGTIYFAASRLLGLAGQVVAVGQDGRELWHYDTAAMVHTSPAIGADGSVYFATFDKKVHALRYDGSMRWTKDFGLLTFAISSPSVGADGTLYVGSIGNYIYALKGTTGDTLWRFSAPGISSPAIGLDGTIYIGSNNRRLYALRPDGSQRWSYLTGGSIVSSPLLDTAGHIYVGSDDGKLYGFDASSGSRIFALSIGTAVRSSPVINGANTLYVGSGSSRLYAIR